MAILGPPAAGVGCMRVLRGLHGQRGMNTRAVMRGGTVVLRCGLGLVFIFTAIPKLQQPYDFLSAVYNYELVGPIAGLWVALVVPWIELVVGISLCVGVMQCGSLLIAMLLLALFTFVRASAVYEGLPISCGCSTRRAEIIGLRDIVVPAGLFVGAALALGVNLALERRPRATDPGSWA